MALSCCWPAAFELPSGCLVEVEFEASCCRRRCCLVEFKPARLRVAADDSVWSSSMLLTTPGDGVCIAADGSCSEECRVLHKFFFVAVQLRSFDDVPFLLERKLRHFLIGSNNGSSLAMKVTFSLSRASSAKSRKSAEPKDFVNP
ncbi:hypothetical protein M5K25_021798 [Dendrobium thyrsiflorum]|uniref:Uncharacterized protein n=1 Tax=Dendrobium thyrsiflorum TaxID=117978 RepID=A0ABD0U567_DENTH